MKTLECACCGTGTKAKKQWYNRDKGYGCCPDCFKWVSDRQGIDEAVKNYGFPGIHHSINFNEIETQKPINN